MDERTITTHKIKKQKTKYRLLESWKDATRANIIYAIWSVEHLRGCSIPYVIVET